MQHHIPEKVRCLNHAHVEVAVTKVTYTKKKCKKCLAEVQFDCEIVEGSKYLCHFYMITGSFHFPVFDHFSLTLLPVWRAFQLIQADKTHIEHFNLLTGRE